MTAIRLAMIASLALLLPSCATQATPIGIETLLRGNGLEGKVATKGKLHAYAGGTFSLYPLDADPLFGSNDQCIALVLDDAIKPQAEQWANSAVSVEGEAMPLSDIRNAIPSDFGTLDGRTWSGSLCGSNVAIFVGRIAPAGF